MSWTIVVVKATVNSADENPERVNEVAGKLALALRNAADLTQAENYDVMIHVDGLVIPEGDVRANIHPQTQKPQEAA